jgi:hypothetical protein
MDQRRIRRVIAAAALAMTLAFAPPARAAGKSGWGPEPGLFGKAWQWLAEIWPAHGGPQQAPAARPDATARSKRSMGTDPNGAQTAAASRSLTPAERSMGTDPNG